MFLRYEKIIKIYTLIFREKYLKPLRNKQVPHTGAISGSRSFVEVALTTLTVITLITVKRQHPIVGQLIVAKWRRLIIEY